MNKLTSYGIGFEWQYKSLKDACTAYPVTMVTMVISLFLVLVYEDPTLEDLETEQDEEQSPRSPYLGLNTQELVCFT